MNSIMGMFGNNIMMQAVGAMMRGESPKQFLTNLAKTNPQLQGLDFNNLQETAQNVCNSNGVDMNAKMQEIKKQLPSM